MVAVISGNGAGLLNSSLGLPGQGGAVENGPLGAAGEAAYLNISNGNLILQRRDDFLAAAGIDLKLLRTYNSQGQMGGDAGRQWKCGLQKQIGSVLGDLNAVGSTVTRLEGDGGATVFQYDAGRAAYLNENGSQSLELGSDQLWIWRDHGGTGYYEVYDQANSGRILTAGDREGARLHYQYRADGLLSSVGTTSGDTTYLDYDASGNLSDYRTVAGDSGMQQVRVRYGYDSLERLVSVTTDLSPADSSIEDGATYVIRYGYDGESSRIATIEQSDGTRIALTYQQVGGEWKVASVADTQGSVTVEYQQGRTILRDASGATTTYTYDAVGRLLSVGGAGAEARASFEYDERGNVVHATQADGTMLAYEYDAYGRWLTKRQPDGTLVQQRSYAEDGRLLTETSYDAALQESRTNYVYDGANRLVFVVSPDGQVQEFQNNDASQRIATLRYPDSRFGDAVFSETSLRAWAASEIEQNHAAERTTFEYDVRGLLASQTDASGTTTFVHDQAGQLLQVVTPDGTATHFAYDGLGRQIAAHSGAGWTELSDFDSEGTMSSTMIDDAGLAGSSVSSGGATLFADPITFPRFASVPHIRTGGSFTFSMDAFAGRFGSSDVQFAALNFDMAPNAMVDIWANPDGTITKLSYALDGWGNAQRFDDKLFVARVQTSNAGISGVFVRGDLSLVESQLTFKDYTLETFMHELVVPESTGNWTNGMQALSGDVLRTSQGFLYRVVSSGKLGISEPPAPSYQTGQGVGAFWSGSAFVEFVGAAQYSGAWQMARNGGVRWYFTNIAAGHLAKQAPTEVKRYLDAEIKNVVSDWSSGRAYQVGMKVGGPSTGGMIWECVGAGSTGFDSAFIPNAAIGTVVTESWGVKWRAVGPMRGSAQWFITDANGEMTAAREPDAHDSSAATLLWAVKQYLDATGDYGWLQQASAHAGMSNADVLKSVLYYNVLTQFVPGLNLTRAFQNDEAPTGGNYAARFMMDNVEVWAGLDAAAKLFRAAGDTSFGNYAQAFADSSLSGLEGLWQESVGAYKWEASSDMAAAPDKAAFYPYVSSQYWASYWGVPLQHSRLERAAQYADAHFQDWQIRSDGDDFASLGVHYGRYLQGKTSDLFEVLDGARRRHLRTSLPGEIRPMEFTAADASLYLLMQDLPTGAGTKFGGLGLENMEPGAYAQNVPGANGMGAEQTHVVLNTGNGNLVLQEHDVQLASNGIDLGLTRTYNSQGGGWQFSAGRSVRLDMPNGIAYRRNGDGSESKYVLQDGIYHSDDGLGAYDQLAYDSLQQKWTWTDGATGVQETYDAANGGRLVSSRDTNGNVNSYGYDANGRLQQIIDASGEKMVMGYGSNGQLLSVRTDYTYQGQAKSVSRVYYDYDADGRLSMVRTDLSPEDNNIGDGNIYWTKYSYVTGSNLVSDVEQKDGSKLHLTYQQDSVTGDWRVDTMTDGEGRLTRVIRDQDGSTIEDATGRQVKYVYTEAGKLQKVTDLATGEYSHYTYDQHGNVVTITDAQGLIKEFAYDAAGNQVEDRITGVRKVTRTFAKPGLVLTESVAADNGALPVQTTRYVYDAQDRLRFMLTPEGRVTESRYNAKGEKTSDVAYNGGAFNLAGLDANAAPSEAQMLAWVNASDRTRTSLIVYTYDSRSLLSTATAYSAVAADGSGVDNGKQSVMRYVYDQDGLLRQTIDSNQRQVSYSYDGLGRQTSVLDSEQPDAVLTVHDDATRTTITTGINGNRTIEVFDRSGQLLNSTVQAGGASGTTTYFYNAKGEPVMVQDAAGLRSFVLYDAKGLKVATIDGDGSLTEFRYGLNGEVSHSIAYAAKVNVAPLVGADGKPVAVDLATIRPTSQAGDRHAWSIYDKQGRLVQTIGPAGYIATTNYDALGRVESVVRHAAPIDTLILGGRDSVSPLNLSATYGDSVVRYFYDKDGQRTAALDGAGSLTEYGYSPSGQLQSSTTYQKPSNWALRLGGGLDALRADVAGSAGVSHYLYDSKGQQVGVVDAGGTLTESVYDALGNVVRKVRYATPVSWQTGATLSSLRPATVAADRGWSYTYTKLNQVETETGPDLTVTKYSYDKLGKVTSVEHFSGSPVAASSLARYDVAGRVTAELPAEAAWRIAAAGQDASAKEAVWTTYGVSYQYDNAGRRISMTAPIGERTLYYYDADGRLAHTVNTIGQVVSTEFNAFNQVSRNITYDAMVPAATLATLSGGDAAALAPVLATLASAAVASRTLYNVDGQVAATVDPLGALTAYRYDAFGNVSESFAYAALINPAMQEADILAGIASGAFADAAHDRHQRFDYDGDGRLVASFTAVQGTQGGQQWTVSTRAYDGAGNLVASTTFAEPVTLAAPTAADVLWKQPSASDERVRIAYDAQGRVTVTATAQKFEGGGFVWSLQTREYDANGLVAVQRTLATQLFSGEPASSDLIAAAARRSPADAEIRYAYDEMGRVTYTAATQGVVGGALRWSASRVSYDKAGNVTERTDYAAGLSSATLPQNATLADYTAWLKTAQPDASRDRTTRYVYDAGNRLHYSVDAQGAVTGQEYDARGNVVQVTEYATQVPGALPTNFVPSTNAADQVSRKVYDKIGRVRYSINAEGGVTEVRYDVQGRIAWTFAYANRIPTQTLSVASTPQDIGTLLGTRLDSARDRVTHSVYDKNGRLRFAIDAQGGVTERRYNALGNLTQTISYTNGVSGTLAEGVMPQIVATAPASGPYILSYPQDRVTTYSYDASGRLASRTDGAGTNAATTQSWAYDNVGNVIRHTDGRGNISWSAYDAAHHLVRQVDAGGYVTGRSYLANGLMQSETRYSIPVVLPQAANDKWAYDAASAPLGNLDPVQGDRTTSWTYNSAGSVQTSTDAAGGVTCYAYDGFGNLTDTTVAYGTSAAATVHRVYDRASRLVTETRAYGTVDAFTTQYGYDTWGNQTGITVGGVTTIQYFDALNRKTGVKDGNQAVTTTAYNTFGDIVKVTDARGNFGYFYSDALGRVTMQVDPEGAVSETRYDLQGNAYNTIRYANKVQGPVNENVRPQVLPNAGSGVYVVQSSGDQYQQSVFDALGRVKETYTGYDGSAVYSEYFSYDGNGNKIGMQGRNGGVTSYQYDKNNRLIAEILPATSKNAANADVAIQNRLEYDAQGNVVKKLEAYGLPEQRVTSYVFDKLNRQVKEIGEAITTFDATSGQDVVVTPVKEQRFDLRGNVIEEIDARGGRILHFYDNGNRETGRVDALGTYTRFTYDIAGQKASQTIYANAVQVIGGGAMSSASAPVLLAAGAALPASGSYVRLDPANDRSTSFTYDGAGRLKTTVVDGITTGVFNKATNRYVVTTGSSIRTQIFYDATGNVVKTIDANGNVTRNYYDRAGRLIATFDAKRYLTVYQFDAFGNVDTQASYANAVAANVVVDDNTTLPQLTLVASADDRITKFTYDRMGRTKTESRLNLVYAAVDATTGAVTETSGAATTTYEYDGLSNVTKRIDANGAVTDWQYDNAGRKTRELQASFVDYRGVSVRTTTDFEYDGLNQVQREIVRGEDNASEADDRITRYFYGTGGYLVGQTDAAQAHYDYRIDAAGNITRKTLVGRHNADGGVVNDVTTYWYDAQGRETRHTDGATGTVSETRYNAFGEISGKRTNPQPGSTEWAEFTDYDQTGHAWRTNAGDGITHVFVYDADGNATLKIDNAVADLRDSAQKTWTLLGVLNLTDNNQFYSVYDVRNQLSDTFQPQMDGSHSIITVEESLTQKQGTSFASAGGGVTMGVAAGLNSAAAAVMPSAIGAVSISRALFASVTLTDRYTYATKYYDDGPSIRSASHTLTVSLPDTSVWGPGAVRVDISIPESEPLLGYEGSFYPTAAAPTLTFNEPVDWESYGSAGGRNFTITIYKETAGGLVELNKQTVWRGSVSGTSTVTTSIATTGNTLRFMDQRPDTRKLVLMTRPSGSSGGWTITDVPKAIINGAYQDGSFSTDWSGMARGSYEFRYVCFNGSNEVVNSQQGTMVLSDSGPSISQMSHTMGGAGRAFIDSNGNIVFNELGGQATSLTVSYRQPGGAWSTQVLAPSSIGGTSLPGWFTFATGGLWGNYEFTIEAKNGAGTTLTKSSSGFTIGSPSTVSDPSGVSVQTSPIATLKTIAVGATTVQASVSRTTNKRYVNKGDWQIVYGSNPVNTLTMQFPETGELGYGNIRVDVRLDPSAWDDGADNYGTYSGFNGSFTVPYGTTSQTWNLPETYGGAGGDSATGFGYSIWKQTANGDVLIASYNGTVNSGTTTTASQTNLNLITFDVQSSGAKATNLMLQFRRQGDPGGWGLMTVPTPAANPIIPAGRYWVDWTWFGAGTFDYRTTALDAAGNVLHTGEGTMTLGSTATLNVAPKTPDLIGGAGRVFMDGVGNLHFTEQGSSATSLSIRYRKQGSADLWSSRIVLQPAVLQGDWYPGQQTPGWFKFTAPADADANLEYVIEVRNSSGQLLNKSAGTFTRWNAYSVSALSGYTEPPAVTHFTSQPANTATMRLSYRPVGGGAYATVNLSKVTTGLFDWASGSVFSSDTSNQDYEYAYESLDSNGVLLNKAHGVVTLGRDPKIASHIKDSLPTLASFKVPDDNLVAATATTMVLRYRLLGSTGAFATIELPRSGNAAFVWDASAIVPPGTSGAIDYNYTLKNGSTILKRDDGADITIDGTLYLGPTNGEAQLKWLASGTVSSSALIHHAQATNAFGEVVSETNARGFTTVSIYNALGKLVRKEDPNVSITLSNGYQQTITPRTYYYYDRAGRMLGSRDANGNLTSQQLLGAATAVAMEYHADGGKKSSGYNIFGDVVYGVDEIGLRTDYSYDKNGRLTLIRRPVRADAARAEVYMTYDEAGNRITQAATPDAGSSLASYTSKTYYDSLGRVSKVLTPAGRGSTYTYVWDAAIKSTGGRVVGGWRQTVSDPMGRTVIDEIDAYGRTTAHTDLGGHQFFYNFNNAGWIISQSGTTGQNISYTYYANGYVKTIRDNALNTETAYEYDAAGNRVYESYQRTVNGNVEYLENASIDYDSNNRVTRIRDPRADIQYEYDAVGNRRRVHSMYHDGVDGSMQVQDYWYDYDNMNRFIVTMGKLSSANGARGASAIDTSVRVVLGDRGGEGVQVYYNKAGQRIMTVAARDGHREDYTYGSEGYLEFTYINADASVRGALASMRVNDRLGRTVGYTEYSGGNISYQRSTVYTADGRQKSQTGTDGTTTYYYYNQRAGNADVLSGISSDGVGELAKVQTVKEGAATVTTVTAYDYWDDAKQRSLTVSGEAPYKTDTVWRPGVSSFAYDINGHLVKAVDAGADGKMDTGNEVTFNYINNGQGLVLRREQFKDNTVGMVHRYMYLNGAMVGDVGNDGDAHLDYAQTLATQNQSREQMYKSWRPVSSADFDQNYQPITRSYPAATGSSYTAKAGDSLYTIAGAVWGDVSMWYLIADANGLTAESELVAGQTLVIPNKVANIHNNSGTFRPYDPGAIIGDTSPTLPDMPPPAPPPGKHGCGAVGMIVMIVVAVVATVLTAGAAAAALATAGNAAFGATAWAAGGMLAAGTTGLSAGMAFAAGAIGAAVGSVASQAVGMAMGVQDKFSWKSVALSAVGGGVSAGVASLANGSAGAMANVFKGTNTSAVVARSVASNLASQGVGSITGLQSFNWRGVAAAGVGAAAGSWLNDKLPQDINQIIRGTAVGFGAGVSGAAVRGGRIAVAQIAADAFGNALGSSLAESMRPTVTASRSTSNGIGRYSYSGMGNAPLELQSPQMNYTEDAAETRDVMRKLFEDVRGPAPQMSYARDWSKMSTSEQAIIQNDIGFDYQTSPHDADGNLSPTIYRTRKITIDDRLAWAQEGVSRFVGEMDEIASAAGSSEGARVFAAATYGVRKIAGDTINAVIGIPRIATSNHIAPSMVDAALNPGRTANEIVRQFKGMSTQDKLVIALEAALPMKDGIESLAGRIPGAARALRQEIASLRRANGSASVINNATDLAMLPPPQKGILQRVVDSVIHGDGQHVEKFWGSLNKNEYEAIRSRIGQTEAGQKVLAAADKRQIYLDFSDKFPPEGLYGYSKGPLARVYTRNTEMGRTYDLLGLEVDGLQQTANIGLHEGLHSLGVGGSRRAEALVRLEELRSMGVAIDRSAMRQVLNDMRWNYDQLPWRAGRTSPSFPGLTF